MKHGNIVVSKNGIYNALMYKDISGTHILIFEESILVSLEWITILDGNKNPKQAKTGVTMTTEEYMA